MNDDEVAELFGAWLDGEAERNPTVEAEHHAYFATLDEADQRSWRERFGDVVAIELTQARWRRFLAENPDIPLEWVADNA